MNNIPKNIFQTWKTKTFTPPFETLINTWKKKNPDYKYNIYDDDDCYNFIKENFPENILDAYSKLTVPAFKADFWRYCILYIYGGIYIDIDTICINNIDKFLNENLEYITVVDLNYNTFDLKHNLFNAFIGCIPNHPIMLDSINRIVSNIENKYRPKLDLDYTGPGLLGRATNAYLNLHEESSFEDKEGYYNNNTICLLKFEKNTEYIKDNKNNILFQNKNGNNIIRMIYYNEIKNNNILNSNYNEIYRKNQHLRN